MAALHENGPVVATPWFIRGNVMVEDVSGVAFRDKHFFLIMTRFGDHLAERVANERAAPELHRPFHSNAIGRSHEYAIGDCMGTLDRDPGFMLFLSKRFFFLPVPTDGRRV